MLRLQPQIRGLFRTTAEPITIAGVQLPAGARILLLDAAANRDPEEWSDPASLRLDRDPVRARRHLTVGGGPHACIGALPAQLELHIACPRVAAARLGRVGLSR